MEHPLTAAAPVVLVLIGGAVLLAGLGVLRGFASRIRTALTHRLPKPFLGDDANMEWAEAKRRELAARSARADVGTASSLGHEVEAPADAALGLQIDRMTNSGGNEGHIHGLLESWIDSSGHEQDERAAQLLSRRHDE